MRVLIILAFFWYTADSLHPSLIIIYFLAEMMRFLHNLLWEGADAEEKAEAKKNQYKYEKGSHEEFVYHLSKRNNQ
jgi:biopolymer transport protein ExbB/TolQ